jgi:hypothetical protein
VIATADPHCDFDPALASIYWGATGMVSHLPMPPRPTVSIADIRSLTSSPGVYVAWAMLCDSWRCVYVGESRNLRKRLSKRPELDGTTLGIHLCERRERKRIECFFIALLNPRMNGQSTTRADHHLCWQEYADDVWDATKCRSGVVVPCSLDSVSKATYLTQDCVLACWKHLQKEGWLRIGQRHGRHVAYIPYEQG